MGREFDDLKQMFFRVRDESNVASASEAMLPVHGPGIITLSRLNRTSAAGTVTTAFVTVSQPLRIAKLGVLFAQADCLHPRGQGTVDVIVTGTAGEATEGLLNDVRKAGAPIAGPYFHAITTFPLSPISCPG